MGCFIPTGFLLIHMWAFGVAGGLESSWRARSLLRRWPHTHTHTHTGLTQLKSSQSWPSSLSLSLCYCALNDFRRKKSRQGGLLNSARTVSYEKRRNHCQTSPSSCVWGYFCRDLQLHPRLRGDSKSWRFPERDGVRELKLCAGGRTESPEH